MVLIASATAGRPGFERGARNSAACDFSARMRSRTSNPGLSALSVRPFTLYPPKSSRAPAFAALVSTRGSTGEIPSIALPALGIQPTRALPSKGFQVLSVCHRPCECRKRFPLAELISRSRCLGYDRLKETHDVSHRRNNRRDAGRERTAVTYFSRTITNWISRLRRCRHRPHACAWQTLLQPAE